MHNRAAAERPSFVPLEIALASIAPQLPVESRPELPDDRASALHQVDADPAPNGLNDALAETLSAVRRFRAAVADAVDAVLDDVLRDIACDVVARELRLAPADIAAIVTTAIARCAPETALAVRVHPEDAAACASFGVRVVEDPQLRSGDAIVELQYGSIDAQLGVRLASLLGAW